MPLVMEVCKKVRVHASYRNACIHMHTFNSCSLCFRSRMWSICMPHNTYAATSRLEYISFQLSASSYHDSIVWKWLLPIQTFSCKTWLSCFLSLSWSWCNSLNCFCNPFALWIAQSWFSCIYQKWENAWCHVLYRKICCCCDLQSLSVAFIGILGAEVFQ